MNFRLLQLVIFASVCLLLLKGSALIFNIGPLLTGQGVLNAQDNSEINKQKEVALKQGATQDEEKAISGPPTKEVMTVVAKPVNYAVKKVMPSNSELDLLESLALRRKQLNLRESKLKLKENLLKAAQRQIDERISQLKSLEEKIQGDLKKQDVLKQGQYRRLVKIYSSMKAKDAARIFDGLDMPILVDMVRAMKAAAGSQILAKMNADKARSLTMLLAKKEQLVAVKSKTMDSELPVIAGDKPAAENK